MVIYAEVDNNGSIWLTAVGVKEGGVRGLESQVDW